MRRQLLLWRPAHLAPNLPTREPFQGGGEAVRGCEGPARSTLQGAASLRGGTFHVPPRAVESLLDAAVLSMFKRNRNGKGQVGRQPGSARRQQVAVMIVSWATRVGPRGHRR